MFLKALKNFLLKRKLKGRLAKARAGASMAPVNSVGIIVDENYFPQTDKLLEELRKHLPTGKISVLGYRERAKVGQETHYPLFDMKAVNYSGEVLNDTVLSFMAGDFDMLISYYDMEKPLLMLITDQTSAHFKVGFSTVDKRLNHFIIAADAAKHNIFTAELFRYLKILNKI